MLLKGIDGDYFEKEIEDELKDLKLEEVNLLKINTKEFFKVKRGREAFLVQVTADSKVSNLFKMPDVASQEVKWKKIGRKNSLQCLNCQRLGHVRQMSRQSQTGRV